MIELALRFIGGTNGPVNFCCVMKGCNLACCGDHLSKGFRLSSPLTKSMNELRFAISVSYIRIGRVMYLAHSIPLSISAGFMFFRGRG